MNSNKNESNFLMITKNIKKGERVYPTIKNIPKAVAEDNFHKGDIGEFDYDKTYPVLFKKNILLLPGLKKNSSLEKKCKNKSKNSKKIE